MTACNGIVEETALLLSENYNYEFVSSMLLQFLKKL